MGERDAAVIVPPLERAHRWLRTNARFKTAGDRVALTFDDGPDPERTPRVLELLATHDVRATFFLVGERVERHPELARRIVALGHDVGSHGHEHRAVWTRTAGSFARDLERARSVLRDVVDVRTTRYRPAYGWVRSSLLATVRAKGLEVVLWSIDSLDWTRGSAAAVAHAASKATLGDTVLFHDGNARARGTLSALEAWLGEMKHRAVAVGPWVAP